MFLILKHHFVLSFKFARNSTLLELILLLFKKVAKLETLQTVNFFIRLNYNFSYILRDFKQFFSDIFLSILHLSVCIILVLENAYFVCEIFG